MERRAGDHNSIDPTAEFDQSNVRIRRAISLSPRRKPRSDVYELAVFISSNFKRLFKAEILGIGCMFGLIEFDRRARGGAHPSRTLDYQS